MSSTSRKIKNNLVANAVDRHTFTVDGRYSFAANRVLGVGSYGVVVVSQDMITGKDMAIKRIRPFATDEIDSKRTLREIRLLMLLGSHPNVISLYALSINEPKKELYMMMELMDTNLQDLIANGKQNMSQRHFKCLSKQLLEGIKTMHGLNIYHRDLKPANILLSRDCQLRIADFGLARYYDPNDELSMKYANTQPMTEYVVTRWYRAPELLLAPSLPYCKAIDIWSVGCIIAEMMIGRPLFPGKNYIDQVQLIFKLLGLNSVDDLGYSVSVSTSAFLTAKCRYPKKALNSVFPNLTDSASSLLEGLLGVNVSDRLTAESALDHPYFQDADVLFDYSMEWVSKPSNDFFSFESIDFSFAELKAMIEYDVQLMTPKDYRNFGRSPARKSSSKSTSSSSDDRSNPRALHRRKSDSAMVIMPDGTILNHLSASAAAVAVLDGGDDESSYRPPQDNQLDDSNSMNSNGCRSMTFKSSSNNPFAKKFSTHRRSRSTDSSIMASSQHSNRSQQPPPSQQPPVPPPQAPSQPESIIRVVTDGGSHAIRRVLSLMERKQHRRYKTSSDILLRVPSMINPNINPNTTNNNQQNNANSGENNKPQFPHRAVELNQSNSSSFCMTRSQSTSSAATAAYELKAMSSCSLQNIAAISSESLSATTTRRKHQKKKQSRTANLLYRRDQQSPSHETDDEDYGDVNSTYAFPESNNPPSIPLPATSTVTSPTTIKENESLCDLQAKGMEMIQIEGSSQNNDPHLDDSTLESIKRNPQVIAQLLSMSSKDASNFQNITMDATSDQDSPTSLERNTIHVHENEGNNHQNMNKCMTTCTIM